MQDHNLLGITMSGVVVSKICTLLVVVTCQLVSILVKNTYNKRSDRRVSQNKSPNQGAGIPPFISDVPQNLIVRYENLSNADTKSITIELPVAPYGIASSTTNVYLPFKSVKLNGYKFWCNFNPALTMANNTISVTAVARRTVRPIEKVATASYGKTAIIQKHFKDSDPLSWWYITGSGETNPELTFVFPPGGILELSYTYIVSDGAHMGTYTTSGLTAGKLYTNSLNTDLRPQGKVDYIAISM